MEKQEVREEKKRGRKPKNLKREYELNRRQSKFFVDVSKDRESQKMIFDFLLRANKKEQGQEVTFKDLALFSLKKLTNKDIEKIQENSLTEMEKVELARIEYNKRTGQNLDLGEYLVRKLNIN